MRTPVDLSKTFQKLNLFHLLKLLTKFPYTSWSTIPNRRSFRNESKLVYYRLIRKPVGLSFKGRRVICYDQKSLWKVMIFRPRKNKCYVSRNRIIFWLKGTGTLITLRKTTKDLPKIKSVGLVERRHLNFGPYQHFSMSYDRNYNKWKCLYFWTAPRTSSGLHHAMLSSQETNCDERLLLQWHCHYDFMSQKTFNSGFISLYLRVRITLIFAQDIEEICRNWCTQPSKFLGQIHIWKTIAMLRLTLKRQFLIDQISYLHRFRWCY